MDPDKFTPQRIDGLYGVFDLPEEKPRQRTSSLPIGRALAIMNGPSATHVYDVEQRSSSFPVGPPSSMREDPINHVDTVMSEDGPWSATGGPEAQHSSNVEPDPTSSNIGDQDMTEATVANSSEATTTTMVHPLGDQTPAAPSFSPTTPGRQPTSSRIIPSLSLTPPVIENGNDDILTSEQRIEGQGSANVTSHSISVSAHSHVEYANNSADIPSAQPIVDQENVTVASQQAVAHVHDAGDTTEITSTQNALDQEVTEESSPRVSAPETAEAEGERGILDEPVQSTIEETNNRSQDASTQPVVEQASDLNASSQQGLTAAQPIILEEGDTIDASVEPTNDTQDDAGIVAQPVSTGAQPVEKEGSTVTNPVESNVEKGDEENLAQEFVATHRRSARIAIAKSIADNQEDANPAPINATTHKKRKAAGKKNDTKATSSLTSTPQKRKATTQDPSADYDYDSSDDEPHLPEPDIYVWPERSPAPESSPPPPKAKRRSGRLTTAKKARKSPSPPPAPPVKKEGTIDASIYPNTRLLQLPADVLQKILDLVLIHPNAVAKPKRKGPYRRIVEAERSHVLTVGFGKITRPPVKGSGKKSNVMKDVNTASPTHFFLICRGLRDVGILTYYRKNTFHFDSEFNLSQWAESLGSRRKFVKNVELKSNWDVFFSEPHPILQNGQTDDDAATAISFPRREDLDMRGGGILFTKTLRCLTDISIVNLTINANMPWSGRRPTMLADAPLETKAMCWDYARKHIDFMLENFRRGELDAPCIEMRPEIFFDWAWVEPEYPSFLARIISGQSEGAVSLKRAVLGLDDENAVESEDVEMQDE